MSIGPAYPGIAGGAATGTDPAATPVFTPRTVTASTVGSGTITVSSAVSIQIGEKIELYVTVPTFTSDVDSFFDLPTDLFGEIFHVSTNRTESEIENVIPVAILSNRLRINRDNNITDNSPFTMLVTGEAP